MDPDLGGPDPEHWTVGRDCRRNTPKKLCGVFCRRLDILQLAAREPDWPQCSTASLHAAGFPEHQLNRIHLSGCHESRALRPVLLPGVYGSTATTALQRPKWTPAAGSHAVTPAGGPVC
jgi:hypothetical protein